MPRLHSAPRRTLFVDTPIPMKYLILTMDWKLPVFFCKHEGEGFTVSTDQRKAAVFSGKKQAQVACQLFEKASGMRCEVKRLTLN
jgi:hypothetical protein